MLDAPTGRAVDASVRRHDLFLLYDAAMEALLFDGREPVVAARVPGMAERTVIVGLDVQGAPDDRLARGLDRRAGGRWSRDAGWVHVYNTTGAVSVARRAAEAVLRGPQEHVARRGGAERRRDAIFAALPGWPIVRPAGGWSLLRRRAALGATPAEASAAMLARGRRRDRR